MFILYQSNDFGLLKHIFLYVIKNNNLIKDKNILLVSNNNISLFLNVFFSKYLDILVNFKYFLTAKFIWNLCKFNFKDISEINYFNRFNLMLLIVKLLPKLINKSEFLILKKYLYNDKNNKKLLSLCIKISDLYDKYLVYRFDLLNIWENNKLDKNINSIHQVWQSILWRKIVNYFNLKFNCNEHRSNILLKLINLLKYKSKVLNLFFNNLFVFNVYNLPPIYLNIIYLLSKIINVHYFIVNPCKEYWYDFNYLNSYNDINKDNNNYFFNYDINLMFLYYSKIFGEFLYLLNNYNLININFFNNKFNNNLLDKIKKNILYFKDFKYKENINDNSLIIKYCNNYLDEVYKLRDFIFYIIDNYNYKCNEIIVVTTNINLYINYINLVFKEYEKKIPFFIMNENINSYDILFKFFIKLLNINDISLNSIKFINFIKNKFIFNKFDISINELDIFLNLIKNVNFIKDINNFSFKDVNYFTILDSIKSLLLGYAVNKDFFLWNNIFSYYYIDNNFFHKLIGKFSNLIFKFIYWRKILSKKFLLCNWINICNEIILDFIDSRYINKYNFLDFFNYKKLFKIFYYFDINLKINNKFFIRILKIYFNKRKKIKQYSLNHLNFCSFLPLRSIPFKVICILGMNLEYPKNYLNCNFDLMYLYYRFGDRNKIEIEKYLFLEYLISAKDKLYISYVNNSIKIFNKCFSSILLDNLLNYIYINFNKLFNIKNKINYKFVSNIDNNIIKIKNNFNNFIIYKNIENYFSLNKLYKFWFNPIKFFFEFCLKLDFFDNNVKFLFFNYYDFYFFRKIFINNLLLGKKFNNNFYLYLKKLNLLPLANFGKILWNNEKINIINLFKNICYLDLSVEKFDFVLNINNKYSFMDIIYFNKLNNIKWLPKNINFIDCLLFWINHLVYCYLGNFKKSILYGYNNIYIFKELNINLSKKYLIFYINGFLSGIKFPLFFLPKFSNCLLYYIYNFNNKSILNNNFFLYKLINKYKDSILKNLFVKNELNNIYIKSIMKYNLNINIDFIINQSVKWLLPMLNYLEIKLY